MLGCRFDERRHNDGIAVPIRGLERLEQGVVPDRITMSLEALEIDGGLRGRNSESDEQRLGVKATRVSENEPGSRSLD